jgi:hypothetical protein
MGVSWLFAVFLRLKSRNETSDAQKLLRKFLVRGTAVVITVFGLVFIWCFSSRYFSLQNMSFGTRAMQLLQAEWSPPITLDLLYVLIRVSFGYVLPLSLAFTAVLAIAYWTRLEPAAAGLNRTAFAGMILATCMYLVVGIWFWIAATGVTQVRYFFPFALMAVICIIPLMMEIVKKLPQWGRVAVRVLWILPAMNLAFLIAQAHPSAEWERWAGIKLTSGTSKEEIRLAKTLLNDVRKSGTDGYLYAFYSGTAHAIVSSVSFYENLVHPSEPTVRIQWPVDWRRPAAHRLYEILESDYILFEPLHDRSVQTNAFSQKSLENLLQEALLFNAWFTNLTEKDGVTVVAETPVARLLKVSENKRLDASLRELKKRYSWRPVFDEENPRRWWSGPDVAQFLKNYPPQMSDVHFGDEIRLHALSLERGENEIKVRLWWDQMHVHSTDGWYFFFHLIDDGGKVIDNTHIPVHSHGPLSPDQPLRFDVVSFEDTFRSVNRLAFGIYHPAKALSLVADKGQRDWDNHRVIVPLPAQAVLNPRAN